MNLKVFQIVDNGEIDPRFPFALADETQTIVGIDSDREALADLAVEEMGADRVEHEGEVLRTDSRFRGDDE